MMALPEIGWTELLLASVLLASYVYYTWTSAYAYWSKRNIPYLKPTFPFGNSTGVFLLRKTFRESWLDLYNRLEDNPFGGIFSLKSPVLLVRDPTLIKLMLTKDFSHFVDRGFAPRTDHEPLMKNIAFMDGEVWRQMRMKLSPTFSSGKLKMMFPLIDKCSSDLELCLKDIFQNKGTFEAKELMSRYTFDTIMTCFFGLKATAVNNADCELYKTAQTFFAKTFWRSLSNVMFVEAPKWYSRLKMHLFHYDACQKFADVIKETIELRENHNINRNDFLDLLIKIKNNISIDDKDDSCAVNNNITTENLGDTDKFEDKNKLTVDDVMSQILGFFIAGYETSSSGLSFCLYELARNPDVQIKLQKELDEAYKRHGGSITYQMLHELPYIDNVISETLRMYSTLSMLSRLCVKPYRIPNTDVVIEKGCRVIIPSYGIHHDPRYYPEPFKFEPDRFLDENVKLRPAYTFLPFGEGSRMCIGTRFAKIQMKLALVTLFSKYNLKLNPKTPVLLKIACGEFLTRSRDEIWFDLCDRYDFLPASMKCAPVVGCLDNQTNDQSVVGLLSSKTNDTAIVGLLDNKTKDHPLAGSLDNKRIDQRVVEILVKKTNDQAAVESLDNKTNDQDVVAFLDNKANDHPHVGCLDSKTDAQTDNKKTIRKTIIYSKIQIRHEIIR